MKGFVNSFLQAPPNSGSTFYNYKGTHSTILLAVSDARCLFTFVDIGGQGCQFVSTIFGDTQIMWGFRRGLLHIPPAKRIEGSEEEFPYVLVADDAFPLIPFMMKPYQRTSLTTERKVFNYRLSHARRTIECAFGIFAARWRNYRKPIIASLSTAKKIVEATVALHNFVMIQERNLSTPNRPYSSYTWRDRETISEGLIHISMRNETRSNVQEAKLIRDRFCNHFNTIGAVPWQ